MPVDSAPRPLLPLLATALLAALFLVRGTLHPLLNYDVIPYVALAKQLRGDGGKAEAYREFAAKVGPATFQVYVSGQYRERMYRDDAFFKASQPLYTIRPFYIFMCALVGPILGSDIAATYVISAVAAALALLLSLQLARAAGLRGNSLLAVPLTWIVADGLSLAELSTPDALETLLTLLFVWIGMQGPWRPARAFALTVIAILMVATRTDAILLLALLILMEWRLQPSRRLIAALVSAAALATYLAIEELSGNYGYFALVNFALLDSVKIVPNLAPNPHGYVLIFIHQVLQALGEEPQSALYFLVVSLAAITWLHERQVAPSAAAFSERARLLAAVVGIYLIVHFALFPLTFPRYVMSAYVLAGILFARVVQCSFASLGRPAP